jgi:pyrimidine-nucleoside phosphorylase
MKDIESATKLAELMVQIGKNAGRSMTAILTDMDEPLGCAVGNQLEVIEAINTLKGNGPKDLTDICLEIGSYLVLDAGVANSLEEAKNLLKTQISNGKAFEKFVELIEEQNGDASYIKDLTKFIAANDVIPVISDKEGYITYINALEIGVSSMLLGGGRETMDDIIDPNVGVVLVKKIEDYVKPGDVLAYVHSNGKNTNLVLERVKNAYQYGEIKVHKELILKVIR